MFEEVNKIYLYGNRNIHVFTECRKLLKMIIPYFNYKNKHRKGKIIVYKHKK